MTAWNGFSRKPLANSMNLSNRQYIPCLIALAVLGATSLSIGRGAFSFSDIVLSAPTPGRAGLVAYPQRQIPVRRSTVYPRIAAVAAGAYDVSSGYRLWEKPSEKSRPIASLTKLMAALVFIDHNPGWQTRYIVSVKDHRSGTRDNLQPGDSVTIRELFRTALVASDNSAVISLVRASGLTEKEFVAAMNERAARLHLKETAFTDPTGLDSGNRSTPGNLSRLAAVALADADIKDAVLRSSYEFTTGEGSAKSIRATDKLLDRPLPAGVRFIGGKTGHLKEAGFCFVGLFEKDGHQVVTVVLGADSDEARFAETEKMVEWVYTTYTWL